MITATNIGNSTKSKGLTVAKVMPMLDYEDAVAAVDFLRRAFGFEETMRLDGDNGSIAHAELALNGASISLSTLWRGGRFLNPP